MRMHTQRPTRSAQHRQHGFTLVELMIAMVLGLILTGGVISLFLQNQQSFRVDETVARMHDEARYAMLEIARDIRMVSFLSEPLAPGAVMQDGNLVVGTDCGVAGQPNWIYSTTDALTGEVNTLTAVDNATGGAAAAGFSCIDAGEIRPNTDVVGIKRVAGGPLEDAVLQAGAVYLRSNGIMGVLHRSPPSVAVPPPFTNWEYRPRIYYIRNFSNAPGDGVPALCRKVLTVTAAPTMVTECIASGIEDLQLEYGIDTTGDGAVNRYVPNPTLAELQRVASVRISLLARTTTADRGHTDERTYRISNAPDYAPADNFHRRVYSTTVPVHNLRNLQNLGIGS